jgi:anti-sigma B factor antagonist
MGITVRQQGNARIIEMKGEFTLAGDTLAQPLDLSGHRLSDLGATLRLLLDQGCRQIVLDLGQVTFLDSAGLGELIACRKRTLEKGGDILLLRPRGKVRELLDMLHLTRVFRIFDDEGPALASFGV